MKPEIFIHTIPYNIKCLIHIFDILSLQLSQNKLSKLDYLIKLKVKNQISFIISLETEILSNLFSL